MPQGAVSQCLPRLTAVGKLGAQASSSTPPAQFPFTASCRVIWAVYQTEDSCLTLLVQETKSNQSNYSIVSYSTSKQGVGL